MKRFQLLFLLCACLAAAGVHAEQMQLEMIPLKQRTPDEIIPIIRPLLAEGGTLTGSGDQLIVKTTPSNLSEIRQVLDSIDRARRSLLITVRQDVSESGTRSDHSLSGSYSEGDVNVSGSDGRHDRGGVVIRGRDSEGNVIEYRARQNDNETDDRNSYRVRTLEGGAAFIRTGQEVPVISRTTYLHGGTVVQQDSTQFYDATSGFYVVPRLSGDRVTLLISPRMAEAGPGHRFDVQEVETTVSGRLGEWISIGGVNQSSTRSDSGILSSRQSQQQSQRNVQLKVEEVQ